jgi:hypothetical protein
MERGSAVRDRDGMLDPTCVCDELLELLDLRLLVNEARSADVLPRPGWW